MRESIMSNEFMYKLPLCLLRSIAKHIEVENSSSQRMEFTCPTTRTIYLSMLVTVPQDQETGNLSK